MIRRLIILLLIVGCVFAQTDTTKTKEDNYKYFLETSGATYFKIVDYEIINDEIKITKDGSNWEAYPITQIKQITDLNGGSIWENTEIIESIKNRKDRMEYHNPLKKNGGRNYYHPYFYTDDEINNFSYQDNVKFKNLYLDYKDNKKYQPLGFLFSSCPIIGGYTGHFYTGNWKKGILFGSSELGVNLIMGYHVFLYATKEFAKNDNCTNENYNSNNECYKRIIGKSLKISTPYYITILATHIWSMVEVYKDINKYNREIYKSIYGREPESFSLNLHPTYQGANLTMSYSFD